MTEAPTLDIPALQLKHGSHNPGDGEYCLLEAESRYWGLPHGDHPKNVSSVITRYGIALNDRLGDTDRQKLKVFIGRMGGTADDGLDEQRRYMLVDWTVRTAVPRYLDVAGLEDAAAQLRALAPVTDETTRRAARSALDGMYDLSWNARQARRRTLRELVAAEYAKHNPTTVDEYVAVAVAVAVVAAVAEVAAAAVAVVAVVAAAAAAAVAVAAAAAAVAAEAEAAVAEVAAAAVAVVAEVAAAAAAVAEAVAAEADRPKLAWGDVYWPVRRALRDKWSAEYAADAAASPLVTAIGVNRDEGIALLGRLINPIAGPADVA